MNIIVDANVFVLFYREVVLNQTLPLSAKNVFNKIGTRDVIYFDENDRIKTEWINVSGGIEWIDIWLSQKLLIGEASLVPIDNKLCNKAIKALRIKGFHKNDCCYIKTALKTAHITSDACIVSNDLHFFDPKALRLDSRTQKKIRKSCKGPIVDELDKYKVKVRSCIAFS